VCGMVYAAHPEDAKRTAQIIWGTFGRHFQIIVEDRHDNWTRYAQQKLPVILMSRRLSTALIASCFTRRKSGVRVPCRPPRLIFPGLMPEDRPHYLLAQKPAEAPWRDLWG